jgi:hypothetical protein
MDKKRLTDLEKSILKLGGGNWDKCPSPCYFSDCKYLERMKDGICPAYFRLSVELKSYGV